MLIRNLTALLVSLNMMLRLSSSVTSLRWSYGTAYLNNDGSIGLSSSVTKLLLRIGKTDLKIALPLQRFAVADLHFGEFTVANTEGPLLHLRLELFLLLVELFGVALRKGLHCLM